MNDDNESSSAEVDNNTEKHWFYFTEDSSPDFSGQVFKNQTCQPQVMNFHFARPLYIYLPF